MEVQVIHKGINFYGHQSEKVIDNVHGSCMWLCSNDKS